MHECIDVWRWDAHIFEFIFLLIPFTYLVCRLRRFRRYILILFPFNIALLLLLNKHFTLMYSLDGSTWHITFITLVVHCSVCVAWLNRLARGSGWLRKACTSACQVVFLVPAQVPLNYGSSPDQLLRKFRSSFGFATTTHLLP